MVRVIGFGDPDILQPSSGRSPAGRVTGIGLAQTLTLQPIRVDTGSDDTEGRLVLAGESLVAVLVRLDGAEHGPFRRSWHLEAAFGPCSEGGLPSTFGTLAEAKERILESLNG